MNYTLVYTSAAGSFDFSIASGNIVEHFNSPSAVNVSFAVAKGSKKYGARLEDQKVSPGNVAIDGVLMGDSTERRQKMLRVFAPMQPGVLQFNGQYFMNVYPKNSIIIERYTHNPRFDISLYAPDPYWHNTGGTSKPLFGIDSLFSFPWEYGAPVQFSGANYGTLNVLNDGDAPTYWELEMIANSTVTNPRVTKTATGEYLQVNATFNAGEKLFVSTAGEEITLYKVTADGTEVDIFNSLDIESTKFWLDVGDNLIGFSPSDGSAAATMTFFKNFAGV